MITVWIVETGQYDVVRGVYRTVEAAMAANPLPPSCDEPGHDEHGWRQLEHVGWYPLTVDTEGGGWRRLEDSEWETGCNGKWYMYCFPIELEG